MTDRRFKCECGKTFRTAEGEKDHRARIPALCRMPKADRIGVTLRLPPDMHKRLAEKARIEGLSLTKYMLTVLNKEP